MRFSQSLIFQVANHISQASYLGLLVYAADLLSILFSDIGFTAAVGHFNNIFAKTVYTIWISWRLKIFKRFLLSKAFRTSPNELGQAALYDRMLNLILYASTVLIMLELYSLEWGIALSSLFAFGGVSTLVISLASKDLASQLINGIALSASDNFQEGESVIFGDKTEGVVTKVGWLHTLIRGKEILRRAAKA